MLKIPSPGRQKLEDHELKASQRFIIELVSRKWGWG
jgi:hypothetical protein